MNHPGPMQIMDQRPSNPDRCHLPETKTEIVGMDRQDVISDRRLRNASRTHPHNDAKGENKENLVTLSAVINWFIGQLPSPSTFNG